MQRATILLFLLLCGSVAAGEKTALPTVVGPWWQVAGNPDLGDFTSDKQQPVDFGIWQAADGTWQIWSCIRHTKCGGHTRLFYRWEGERLTDTNWQPMGIAMQADPALGEARGGLQAPHVFREGDSYFMVYGDWHRICLAASDDGKSFSRVANDQGQPVLFSGPYDQVRDAIRSDSYYCIVDDAFDSRMAHGAIDAFCPLDADGSVKGICTVMATKGGQGVVAEWVSRFMKTLSK